MNIIGLTGFAKSGKSTAAQLLKEFGGQEVSFANHLKDVCAAVFRINRTRFDDQATKEVPFAKEMCIEESQISEILEMFEVPKRFLAGAILTHRYKTLTTPRHVAQYVGTDILRKIDTDIHVDMAFKLNAKSNAPFLIVSDIRFENELHAVQSRSGSVIGIARHAAMPIDFANLHASEREVPSLIQKADFKVYNNSTMGEFAQEIQKAYEAASKAYIQK